MTDDTMTLAEASERAAAMLETESNRVMRWAEGAVPELMAEYGIDQATAARIVQSLASKRLDEIKERMSALMHELTVMSRPAPPLH